MKRALELQEIMSSGKIKTSDLDSLVDFLLPYVSEPTDRDQARDLLWDASQDDFTAMLQAINGVPDAENPT